jgi:Ca-activated chloride channel family protein
VAQEQFVIRVNRESASERLVAIYPADGAMWLDHPLALLDGPWVTPESRVAYRAFASYLGQPEVGQQVLAAGYRPANVRLAIDEAASPIRAQNGVDPAQPFSSLPLPSTAVMESIRESWSILKRPANIILVVDVSGSMAGTRMAQAQEALLSFVSQIRDGRDRVSLITFSSEVRTVAPLDTMDRNRATLERSIRGLSTGGNTALYDAIDEAVTTLARRRESDRINVVLAMTDGEVNQSSRNLLPNRGDPSRLIEVITRSMQGTVPVAVYTVAYGGEAEFDVLRRIATSTKAQAYRSDPDTIRRLYRLLSAEF